MKNNTIIFAAILTLACVAGLGQIAFGQNGRVLAEAQRITGDNFTVSVKTPKGASIYAVSKPSAAVFDAIDKGLDDPLSISRKNGHRNRPTYTRDSVLI